MKHLNPLLFALIALCLTVPGIELSAEPVVTGTVEVDLGDALKPLHEADKATNSRVDALEARVAALEAGTPPPPVDPPPVDPPVDPVTPGDYGINPEPVTYYQRSWVFADLALTISWRGDVGYIYTAGHPPAGTYTASWSGSGSVTFGQGFQTLSSAGNQKTVRVDAQASALSVARSGDVKNLRIVLNDTVGPFHPLFIERLKPFKIIRFMDWQQTNNAGPRTWSTRVMPGDSQIGSGGVAIEYMVALCNQLGADPWLCIPHRAEPHYVRTLAEYCRDNLHPGATVYVEWSNEVWNSQFDQHQWLADVSGSDRLSDAWFDRWAVEASEDFKAFREVLGDRAVRVLGVHLQNDWIAKKLVPRVESRGGYDALSPSAYFGLTRDQVRAVPANVTIDRLIDLLSNNIEADNTRWYASHRQIAGNHALLAYEGGFHGPHAGLVLPWQAQARALQTDTRMVALYDKNLAAWRAAGGKTIAAYNFAQPWNENHGTFGHLEYQDQPISDAPKYRAITGSE